MGKSTRLIVRVGPAELEALRAAAAREGYPGDGLSEWVRRTLFKRAGIPTAQAYRPEGKPRARAETNGTPPTD